MVLNIFPRGKKPETAPAKEAVATLPEPSPEVMESLNTAIDGSDGSDEPKKRPTRRGSRGGRGRARTNGADALDDGIEQEPMDAVAGVEVEAAPAKAPRRASRAKAAITVPDAEAPPFEGEAPADATPAEEPAEAPRTRRGTPRQQAEIKAREEEAAGSEGRAPAAAPGPRGGRSAASTTTDSSLVRAIEQQSRQIEQLVEAVRRGGGGGGGVSAAPPARVGVFVDAANVELASDRLRARFDWRKILDMLTRDRQLVRAIAYSPVHDDPGVSIETQRFVEPFLDKGYKVVTKPLKRFQDGTIKANVDIEMALDVMEMLDRLDVVCLISGDGDFQRLVEVVQSKGVRVEVVAVGNSTAGNLRKAADHYIDLQQHLRDIRA